MSNHHDHQEPDDQSPAGHPSTSTRTRTRSILIPVIVGVALCVCIGGSALFLVQAHNSKMSDLAQEARDGKKRLKALKAIEVKTKKLNSAEQQRLAKIAKRVKPLQSRANRLRAKRKSLQSQVSDYQTSIATWVEVPEVAGEAQAVAESLVTGAGLAYETETIEGTCTDYTDHFDNRDLGWFDVVKQDPSPGSRVPPTASVTIYMWDYYSGWELGCQDTGL